MTQCVLLLVFSAAENWQPVRAKLCPYPIYDRLELIWVLTCMGNILDPAKEMQPVEVYGRFMPHEFLSSYSNDQPLAGSWYPSPSTEETARAPKGWLQTGSCRGRPDKWVWTPRGSQRKTPKDYKKTAVLRGSHGSPNQD